MRLRPAKSLAALFAAAAFGTLPCAGHSHTGAGSRTASRTIDWFSLLESFSLPAGAS